MKLEDVNALYDRDYAATYDDKFIHRDIHRSDAAFEVGVLAKALERAESWLDVGCGTGYFLSQFPGRRRAGVDVSTAMLERARTVNPDADFHLHDYRLPRSEWRDAWDLVSSMWHAYGYVDTIDQFDLFLNNISDWTAPDGALFLPYLDIYGLWDVIPFDVPSPFEPAKVYVKGLIWNFAEPQEKIHHNMISPHADYIRNALERRFSSVQVIEYPPAMPDWKILRRAFLAKGKRQ